MYNVAVGETEKSRFEIQQTAFSTLWWPRLPKELIIYHPALIGLSELCKGCFPDQPWNQTLIPTSTHKPPDTYLTETTLAWSCSQFAKHAVTRLFNLDCLRGETTETVTFATTQDFAWAWADGLENKSKQEDVCMLRDRVLPNTLAGKIWSFWVCTCRNSHKSRGDV